MNWTDKKLVIAGMIILSLLLYFPSYRYGMVSDFLGWIWKYKNGSWDDLPGAFGYPGLHQFFHLVNFAFYKLAGLNHFAWYVLFSVLHGINAFLVFIIAGKLADIFAVPRRNWVSTLAAVVFLVSPYQVEPVAWKACMHYLMSAGMHLGAFYYLLEWWRSHYKLHLVRHFLLLILSFFTLEINLASPFIYLAFISGISYTMGTRTAWKHYLKWVFLPHIFLIAIYFLLNQWWLGSWIGHYGADQHLRFSPVLILGNGLKYLFKYLFFTHHLPFDWRRAWYGLLENPWMYYALSLVMLAGWIKLIRNGNGQRILVALTLMAFFMGVFPVVNLYFTDVLISENDRYGYFASPYIYIMASILMVSFWQSKWKFLALIYFFVHLLLFGRMITRSYEAGEVYHALLDDYRWESQDTVYLLNSPENYSGMYLFRNYDARGTTLKRALSLLRGKDCGEIIDVAQSNMIRPDDAINVNKLEEGRYQVMLGQGGTWFWRKGQGLTDYSTEVYSVDLDGWFYLLEFTDSPNAGRVLLTTRGNKWVKVDP